MLREELGRAPDVAVGVDDLPMLKRRLNKAYANLYLAHDWPFLRRMFPRQPLSAGQRYYDLPADLNMERIEEFAIWWNDLPHYPDRGISARNYASFDSEATTPERSDPVLAWDIRDVAGATQIEVWPIPASANQSIQITGIRSAPKLVNNADICLLDDDLVVLHAAAAILKRQKSADAQEVAAEATSRFQLLKGRSSTGGSKRYRMGTGPERDEALRADRAVVRISASS